MQEMQTHDSIDKESWEFNIYPQSERYSQGNMFTVYRGTSSRIPLHYIYQFSEFIRFIHPYVNEFGN